MLQFFKYVLATVAGLFVFFLLSLFLLIGIGSMFSSADSTVTVKEKSVLKINLNQIILEDAPEDDPFAMIFEDGPGKVGLISLKSAIRNAQEDPSIKGIYLDSGYPQASFGTLEELRNVLKEFKESGKFIYAYSEVMSEQAVYINSVADRIFLNKAGGLEFNGLYGEVTFYKGLFDKIGVKPLIFKVGDYKSAVEPFIRTNMSDANREQVTSYINSIAGHIYHQVAESRGLTDEEVKAVLDENISSAEDALDRKVVTDIVYFDEFEAALRKVLEIKEDDKINFISAEKYGKAKKMIKSGDRNQRIAVIIGQGSIVSGEGSNEVIASESWIAELRKAVKDDKVKAIVLRINSGGGSALASDIMWREIQIAKKEKPVYASMGDYAASGGYYMAMGCDTIFANPTTITGSIGIFGMLVNAEELLNNKLGVTFDGVESHEHSNFPSVVGEMSDVEKMMIQKGVNEGYEKFTSKAAEGRNMAIEDLKAIASGRVWTGLQAKENGLVDILGSLEDAIQMAAENVGIEDDFQVRYYPKAKSDIELIMEKISEQSSLKLDQKLGILAPYLKEINELQKMDKLQARMPYEIKIK
ncbi:signal peptide peptidase SppA [Arcticibacterium luteifluviistationis]|uniref:Signal peptide peptidase SppA n=1 Tax=Arcticibacterium luteifluviistationis TaxID=1784714 RepID=A0A2Z4GEG5_9BACT|nr:signal peptide peptidase SppA [Arcticibacterium luteifluviistationis]AWV99378.1 signal peptide peptidase SppA [Arcticibacterium luteifluviistationis]